MQQAGQARERALDAVLARVDVPLPERLVAEEIDRRDHSLDEQLERAGLTRETYLTSRELTSTALDEEIAADARRFVTASFVLDQFARQEEIGVEQEELNAYLVEQAYRLGVPPDRLAKEIVDRGQLGVAVTEVLRAKALELLAERATVTDEAGRPVDIKALAAAADAGETGTAEAGAAGADAAGADPADGGPDTPDGAADMADGVADMADGGPDAADSGPDEGGTTG
jgi:trigger factor